MCKALAFLLQHGQRGGRKNVYKASSLEETGGCLPQCHRSLLSFSLTSEMVEVYLMATRQPVTCSTWEINATKAVCVLSTGVQ